MQQSIEHHRRSVRLPGYDYRSNGAYFLTICTNDRECLFGDVVDGIMYLNEFGTVVQEEWMRAIEVQRGMNLDVFVVMPNHVHGIIVIDHVGATQRVAPRVDDRSDRGFVDGYASDLSDRGATRWVAPTAVATNADRPHGPPAGSVGAMMGQFKSMATKRIHVFCPDVGDIWQRSYYDHVIRSEGSLARIRSYIEDNPINWEKDPDHPFAEANDKIENENRLIM